MGAMLGCDPSWWVLALILFGAVCFIAVFGALFLPDWPEPDYTLGLDERPGSEAFVEGVAGMLNVPLLRGGTVKVLQNGDQFYPAMLEALKGAKDSINFEVYIYEPDEIGRQFMDVLMERARAGIEVRMLLDGFGSWKLKRRHRG